MVHVLCSVDDTVFGVFTAERQRTTHRGPDGTLLTLGSRAYCGRAVGAPAEGPRVRIARRVLELERRVLIDPADGIEERVTASEFDLLKIFAENRYRS